MVAAFIVSPHVGGFDVQHRPRRRMPRPSGPPLSHHVGSAASTRRHLKGHPTWSAGAVTDDFERHSGQAGRMRTKPPGQSPARVTRRCFLAEVRLRVTAGDLSWMNKSLAAACLRVRGSNLRPEILSAVYIPDDDRLSCVVEAACAGDIHQLFGSALLPSVRVVEATVVALRTPRRESAPSPDPTRAQPSAQPLPGS
jgi:hypothetical protein